MTEDQIKELFIKAAEVDKRLPQTAKPARLKAMALPYVHDQADQTGWGGQRYEEERLDFWDAKTLRLSRNEIGIWEAAMETIKLVPSEQHRRALWAWARSEAGGQAFAKWCKNIEGISRQVGNYRRNMAILQITRAFSRKPLQHNENTEDTDFTFDPEIGDKSSNIRVWRPDESKPICGFDEDLRDFSWAQAQAERRRQREKRKAA